MQSRPSIKTVITVSITTEGQDNASNNGCDQSLRVNQHDQSRLLMKRTFDQVAQPSCSVGDSKVTVDRDLTLTPYAELRLTAGKSL